MTDDQKWILGLGVAILLAVFGTSAGMTWHFNSRIDRLDDRLDSHVTNINENLKDLAIKVETNSVNMKNIDIRVGNLEAEVRSLDLEIERFGQGHEKLVGYVEGRTARGVRGAAPAGRRSARRSARSSCPTCWRGKRWPRSGRGS